MPRAPELVLQLKSSVGGWVRKPGRPNTEATKDTTRLAVLIDADDAQASRWEELLTEVATVWGGQHEACLQELDHPEPQGMEGGAACAGSPGDPAVQLYIRKNATDLALITFDASALRALCRRWSRSTPNCIDACPTAAFRATRQPNLDGNTSYCARALADS